MLREAQKESFFLVARPLKGGGGKGLAIKKKELFSKLYKNLPPKKNKQQNIATKN